MYQDPSSRSVEFCVQCQTKLGEEVRVVGNQTKLGQWDPSVGLVLDTTPNTYPVWSKSIYADAGESLEFKAVISNIKAGQHYWETITGNRTVQLAATSGNLRVTFAYGKPGESVVAVPKAVRDSKSIDKFVGRSEISTEESSSKEESGTIFTSFLPHFRSNEGPPPSKPSAMNGNGIDKKRPTGNFQSISSGFSNDIDEVAGRIKQYMTPPSHNGSPTPNLTDTAPKLSDRRDQSPSAIPRDGSLRKLSVPERLRPSTPISLPCGSANSSPRTSPKPLAFSGVRSEDNEDKYNVLQVIGKSIYGFVHTAEEVATGQPWAMERIPKASYRKHRNRIERFIEALRRVDHPNVLKLRDVFQTPTVICIVMKLIQGGHLFDRMMTRGSLTERDAAEYLGKIAAGLHHMHERGIVHSDIKPENLMYYDTDPDSELVIINFTHAHLVNDDDHDVSGTPEYMAPEVTMGKGYSPAADMWGLGVVMYIMLSGYLPFSGSSYRDIFERIQHDDPDMSNDYWDRISAPAKDLLSRLLVKDPELRLSASDTLEHPWINCVGAAACSDLSNTLIPNLHAFIKRAPSKALLAGTEYD